MIHDGDKKKDFFKSIKTLYKVQDLLYKVQHLHEGVCNATENSASFYSGWDYCGVYVYYLLCSF